MQSAPYMTNLAISHSRSKLIVSTSGSSLMVDRSQMRDALTLEHSRRDQYPEAAVARTEFHLSQILRRRGKDLEEAEQLLSTARQVLDRLPPLNPLEGVPREHEIALFDHIQPIFDGRFTGTLLL